MPFASLKTIVLAVLLEVAALTVEARLVILVVLDAIFVVFVVILADKAFSALVALVISAAKPAFEPEIPLAISPESVFPSALILPASVVESALILVYTKRESFESFKTEANPIVIQLELSKLILDNLYKESFACT